MICHHKFLTGTIKWPYTWSPGVFQINQHSHLPKRVQFWWNRSGLFKYGCILQHSRVFKLVSVAFPVVIQLNHRLDIKMDNVRTYLLDALKVGWNAIFDGWSQPVIGGQVYWRELHAAALLPDHCCAHSGSKWRHQHEMGLHIYTKEVATCPSSFFMSVVLTNSPSTEAWRKSGCSLRGSSHWFIAMKAVGGCSQNYWLLR